MRLSKLKVRGFRSIKDEQTLIIDQRVTILIGANDHGKSNLLAAIHCLNNEQSISKEDRNWDIGTVDPVEIEWHFMPDEARLRELEKLVPQPNSKPEPDQDGELSAIDLMEAAKLLGPTLPVDPAGAVVFRRDIETNEVRVVATPFPILAEHEPHVRLLRPRVELFESPKGNLVDQVTRPDLDSPSYEFMQGIFRLAGLWEIRDSIFVQNDRTSKQLKDASLCLTRILNDQWNQGKDLKWIFEHTGTNGDSIVIKIHDPSIDAQYTRPSLRSSGFRTYFLLSMIIYARSKNRPSNSHIYLFDEPGTYLHPSAQLDLQRSFEAIADQAQIVYTTHSLFLISKNYPERNRVISKNETGTKIDQKPFSKNWKSVRRSLGILFSNNFLIADKTLLVEGPSDTIYLLEAIKKLNESNAIDIDLNDLSVVDAGDSQNLIAMAKIMLSEGRSVVVLVDGDSSGKKLIQQLGKCFPGEKKLQTHSLPDGKSSEDVFAALNLLQQACKDAFESLVRDGFRTQRDDLDLEKEITNIGYANDKTLGRVIEESTKSWCGGKEKEKVSKLLIALRYEDLAERDQNVQLPTEALPELQKISELLGLRSEKSRRSGALEGID